MRPIELEPISEENYRQVLELKLARGQERFVATNTRSLAEAYIFRWLRPFALMVDGTLVGFMMYGLRPEKQVYCLVRLMISAEWQGRGYGALAVKTLLDELRAANDAKEIYLSLVSANTGAMKLYKRFGFEETGEIDEDGEIVMRRAL